MARYTAEFESDAITRLKDAQISVVAEQMELNEIARAGAQERAVKRGLASHRADGPLVNIGIDKSLFRKGHHCITVV